MHEEHVQLYSLCQFFIRLVNLFCMPSHVEGLITELPNLGREGLVKILWSRVLLGRRYLISMQRADQAISKHCRECVALLEDLGLEVEHILLPTFAYEHKIFVGPFSRKFPKAQVRKLQQWRTLSVHTCMSTLTPSHCGFQPNENAHPDMKCRHSG